MAASTPSSAEHAQGICSSQYQQGFQAGVSYAATEFTNALSEQSKGLAALFGEALETESKLSFDEGKAFGLSDGYAKAAIDARASREAQDRSDKAHYDSYGKGYHEGHEDGMQHAQALTTPEAIVNGALFDFMGYLTTRPGTITVGSEHSVYDLMDAYKEWADKVDLKGSLANVIGWHEHVLRERNGPIAYAYRKQPAVTVETEKSEYGAWTKVEDLKTWGSGTPRDVCGATTSRGSTCQRFVTTAGARCIFHGGKAQQTT